MVFKCQEDSFAKKFLTNVVCCTPAQLTNADKKVLDGYNVILQDTILFPEGGGQPCDYGYLNNLPVKSVTRKGALALHFVEQKDPPFSVGDSVLQILDWERRIDHMQQHSGQHLITALFEREYQYDTKSWWLGSDTSYIELDAKEVTEEQVKKIEQLANNLIAEQTPVRVNVYEPNDPALTSDVTRATRGLPKDVTGPLRVVTIEGVESNMCCGTHVKNLSQLQMVKLLNVEKAKGKIFLHFLVGNRVLAKLNSCFLRELQLNNTLNGGPQKHVELIQKLQTNFKATQKTMQKMAKEVALYEANKLNSLDPAPKYYFYHRNDGIESDFLATFLKNITTKDTFLFLTSTIDDKGRGQLVLQGKKADEVSAMAEYICDALDGKGNCKGTKFQAKVNSLKRIADCEAQIVKYFAE